MPVLEHETLVEVGTVDSKPQDEQMIQAAGNKNHVYLVAVLGVAMICLLVVLVGAELSNDPELHVQRVRVTIPYANPDELLTVDAPAGNTSN